ncbi:polysaccharide deacetylase family protein [Virgibacillus sp. FSP13]
MNNAGQFIISLDFELNWGMFDVFRENRYKDNLLGAREIVPLLLHKFQHQDIHATWGIVGFLFFSNKQELWRMIPDVQPQYANPNLSAYHQIKSIGVNEAADPIHFGASLVEQIKEFPNQEVATHTFSHYYCLDAGQDQEAFAADLQTAVAVAHQHDISIQSIIFPRNQIALDYLPICKTNGIHAYRGCESHWLYQVNPDGDGKVKRLLRLLDSYINITGHHIYSLDPRDEQESLMNIPSSRFLRPYTPSLRAFESLKLRRIKKAMTKAAKEGKLYHLWWHPHNFGVHQKENLQMLDRIITHFHQLRKQYGMESVTMQEASEKVVEPIAGEKDRQKYG